MNATDEVTAEELRDVPPDSKPAGSLPQRWAEGILFVAAWTGLGWALELDPNAYLLMGVPLTLAFQWYVRGLPTRAMWIRDVPSFGRIWMIPTVLLGALPAVFLVVALIYRQWAIAGWMLAAIAGSVGAGYCLTHLRRAIVRPFVMCQVTAGLMGVGMMIMMRANSAVQRPIQPFVGLHNFFLFFPVCFALEEVSFRGMLDSHLHRPGDRFGLTSALLGSMLWGLWHLPTLPVADRTLEGACLLMVVHALLGVPLATYWRQSGNLVVPAFTHAMVDAVRDMLVPAG